jgi:hypothetical protein
MDAVVPSGTGVTNGHLTGGEGSIDLFRGTS